MSNKIMELFKKRKWFIIISWFIMPAIMAIFMLYRQNNSFDDLAALNKEQGSQGYVLVGTFGNSWPAKIAETKTGYEQISFIRSSGQQHTYRDFPGYELKMIRLKAGSGEENIMVFRSRKKIGENPYGIDKEQQQIKDLFK